MDQPELFSPRVSNVRIELAYDDEGVRVRYWTIACTPAGVRSLGDWHDYRSLTMGEAAELLGILGDQAVTDLSPQ